MLEFCAAGEPLAGQHASPALRSTHVELHNVGALAVTRVQGGGADDLIRT
jgi:hypothetical protein